LIYRLLALNRLISYNELNKIVQNAQKELKLDSWFHFNLACYYAMTDNNEKAIIELKNAIELGWNPNSILTIFGTFNEPLLYNLQKDSSYNSLKKEFQLESNVDLEKQFFYRNLINLN
jgi:hypothetical protein